MPVPNPTTLELAQAGALIVGVERREAALSQAQSDLRAVVKPTWRVAAIFFAVAILLVLVAPADDRLAVTAGASAIVVAALALVVALYRDSPLDLVVGYRPEELAQLVGYAEVTDVPGQMRRTALGDQAVAAYLAWREPRAVETGDSSPEHHRQIPTVSPDIPLSR